MTSSARIDDLQRKYEENPRRYFAPLASELRRAGEARRAVALCEAGLAADPGHLSGHVVLAQALAELGDGAGAERAFERAVELDSENLVALRSLGDLARDRGDREAARGWYQHALEADPRDPELATRLSTLDAAPAAGEAAPAPGLDVASGAVKPSTVQPVTEPAQAPDRSASAAPPDPETPPGNLLDEAQAREFQEQRDAQEFTAGFFASLLEAQATPTEPVRVEPAASEARSVAAGVSDSADLSAVVERPPEVTIAEEVVDVRPDEPRFLDDLMNFEAEDAVQHHDAESPHAVEAVDAVDASEPGDDAATSAVALETGASRWEFEHDEASPLADELAEAQRPLAEDALPSVAADARIDVAPIDDALAHSTHVDEAQNSKSDAPDEVRHTDAPMTDEAPVEQVAAADTLVDDTMLERVPSEQATPGDEALLDEAAGRAATIDEAMSYESPADESPVGELPVEELPVEELPVEELPVEELPVDALPVDELPAAELPAVDEPVDEAPLDEAVADWHAPDEGASRLPFVTATMGTLLLQQGFRSDALQIFRQLAEQHPDDADMSARVAALEAELEPSTTAGSGVTVANWLRQLADGRPAASVETGGDVATDVAPAGVPEAGGTATDGVVAAEPAEDVAVEPVDQLSMATESPLVRDAAEDADIAGVSVPLAADADALSAPDLLSSAAAAAASAVTWEASEATPAADDLFFGDDPLDWGEVTAPAAPDNPWAPAEADQPGHREDSVVSPAAGAAQQWPGEAPPREADSVAGLTLDELLGRPVPSADEMAAGALAAVTLVMQGDDEVDAQLAEATAEDPAALEHVLAPAPVTVPATRETTSFSFEQFFQPAPSAAGSDAGSASRPAAPAASEPEQAQPASSRDEDAAAREADLADFHAWLAGLSKS